MTLLRAALLKMRAMCDGVLTLLFVLLLSALSFGLVDAVTTRTAASSVRVAVVDEDQTAFSAEVLAALSARDGLSVTTFSSRDAAEDALYCGDVEGVLTLQAGFAASAASNAPLAYSCTAAAGAVTAQLLRESVVATAAIANVRIQAEAQVSAWYDGDAKQALSDALSALDDEAAASYSVTHHGGTAQAQATLFDTTPKQAGVVALFAAFVLVSLYPFLQLPDSRRVAMRLLANRKQYALGVFSDWLAMFFIGLMVDALALLLLRAFSVRAALLLLPYLAALSSFGLALGQSKRQVGGVDLLIPFVVLLTSLLGGCLFNLAAYSDVLRVLSYFTPQGMYLYSVNGNGWLGAIALLLLCFAGLCVPFRRRS